MGNIGWAVWNRVSGSVEWSDQLYRIFERDPAAGPMSLTEYLACVHPDDADRFRAANDALVERGEPIEMEYRVQVGGRIKHLRAAAEATLDGAGQPLEITGFIQDISVLRRTRQRLEVIRRELESHQQLLAEEHRLAVQLQRIILPVPDAPMQLPGMRVAVRYMPAEQLARVGGDWFQVNPLPDGALLLAVGDVAGHGLTAAATMAQLRHALAGLAMLARQPAAILGALNALLCAQPDVDALIATAVVARYDPARRTLVWAQAGHPPALLARVDEVQQLQRPEGMLLGVARSARYDQATTRLEPGDLLLMYTDGLIERPGSTLDDGLHSLTETVSESLRAPGRDPLTSVIRRLRRAHPGDDTCILAAQLTA
jgi:serine phosphatase RsbU (regulator of sigma subunit)